MCRPSARTKLHLWLLTAMIVVAPVLIAHGQRGALTVTRGLDELSQEAAVIVRGHVASARVEPHPQLKNLTTVVVSIDVEETLKGTPSKTLEFRQFIWDIRDQLDAARYLKGEELLLLLRPVSRYGLTSPVGMEQGRFRVIRDLKGNAAAVNGKGNVGLFHATEERVRARGQALSARQAQIVRQSRPGPMPLADLEEAIRGFGGTK